jgi:hypothetical protein
MRVARQYSETFNARERAGQMPALRLPKAEVNKTLVNSEEVNN